MRRLCLSLAVALAPVFGAAQSPSPQKQEPVPTFRAGVRAIQIDAVVTDEDGKPVRGLTEKDFEITERGRPQAITTFEAVDLPIERQLPDDASSSAGGEPVSRIVPFRVR